MTIFIILIAALALGIVLMNEYGWTDLTGSTRNNVVFEDRNKSYGAFEIRQKYSNRLIVAFFGALGFVTLVAMSPKMITSASKESLVKKEGAGEKTLDQIEKKKEKEEIFENKPKMDEPAPKAPDVSTQQSHNYKASDDKIVQDTTSKVDKSIAFSNQNHKGTDSTSTSSVSGNPQGTGGNGKCLTCDSTITVPPIATEAEVDEKAEFDYQKHFRRHLRIPEGSRGGRVFVSFVVDASGHVTQAKIKRGVDPMLDEEIKRVASIMPQWKPAKIKGESVAVRMVIPINVIID